MAVIKLNRTAFEKKQKEAGFDTDTKLARAMGINRTQVWRVKEGKSDPGEEFIAGALKALKVGFDEIFFLQEPLQEGHSNDLKTGTDCI